MNKLETAIRENQKRNHINTNIKTVSEKEAEKTRKKSKKAAFMAIAKGRQTTETAEIKHYVGIAPSIVVGVCPTKDELATIYGRPSDNEPNYMGEFEVDGNKVPQVRVSVYLQPDPEKYQREDGTPIPAIQKAFFIAKTYWWNRSKTKLQVIDKYGRTAWVTKEQLANHEIPMYTNGLANLDKDYRPAYLGEATLTEFLKAYLDIPDVQRKVENSWVTVDGGAWCKGVVPSDCEVRLDNIDALFTGNFKEIKEAIAGMPTNRVKALYGVKSVNGKLYPDVFETFAKNADTKCSKIVKNYEQRKSVGAYPNTEFHLGEFKEYSVEATSFGTTTPNVAMPNPFDEEPAW